MLSTISKLMNWWNLETKIHPKRAINWISARTIDEYAYGVNYWTPMEYKV